MKTTPRGLARQIALFSAVALAAAGCGGAHGPGTGTTSGGVPHASPTPAPSTPPSSAPTVNATYALTLYWSFDRHVLGQAAPVIYDPTPGPGGTGSGACSQSGVDTVVVYDASGTAIDPAGVPCVYEGVQGVSYAGFSPGTYDLIVRGFRSGIALYETSISVDVTTSGGDAYDVSVPGIPDDLDIYASFVDPSGAFSTCAHPANTLKYTLFDSAGTIVDAAVAPCADRAGAFIDPAGVSLRGGDAIDLDTYTIEMQEVDPGDNVVSDSRAPRCAVPTIDHLGSDTSAHGWTVNLYAAGTACQ